MEKLRLPPRLNTYSGSDHCYTSDNHLDFNIEPNPKSSKIRAKALLECRGRRPLNAQKLHQTRRSQVAIQANIAGDPGVFSNALAAERVSRIWTKAECIREKIRAAESLLMCFDYYIVPCTLSLLRGRYDVA
ncbi:proteophosphoglycan 5 [Moniliophthora roreri]|nr:proteophosphoglycan 5 [Moniliophthora roreri]